MYRLVLFVLIGFTLLACKSTESQLTDAEDIQPYVDIGEQASYAIVMRRMLSPAVANTSEIRSDAEDLFLAKNLGQETAKLESAVSDTAILVKKLSENFAIRMQEKSMYDNESGTGVSVVEMAKASENLEGAYRLLSETIPAMLSKIKAAPQDSFPHLTWMNLIDLIGTVQPNPNATTVGSYLATVENYMVKWILEVNPAYDFGEDGPPDVVVDSPRLLSSCPLKFRYGNIEDLQIVIDVAELTLHELCLDFGRNLSKAIGDQVGLVGYKIKVRDISQPEVRRLKKEIDLPIAVDQAMIEDVLAQLRSVTLYYISQDVDTQSSKDGEAYTISRSLDSLDMEYKKYDSYSLDSFKDMLVSTTHLIVPELEKGSMSNRIGAEGREALKKWVESGGAILIIGSDKGYQLVNQTFGWGFSKGSNGTFKKQDVANSTQFAGGPETLPANNGTFALKSSSLPETALDLYSYNGSSGLACLRRGLGAVYWISWDWYNAKPVGNQDGGWLNMLAQF